MKRNAIVALGGALAAAIILGGALVHQHYRRSCPRSQGRSIAPVDTEGLAREKCQQDHQFADQSLIAMGIGLVVVVMATGLGCALTSGDEPDV